MTALAGSTSTIPAPAEKAAVRREARRRRRALGADERAPMDAAICRHIERLGAYRRAHTVAIYLSFDGEPSITRLPMRTGGRAKRFCSPVLDGPHMHFRVLGHEARLPKNAFGIREPLEGDRIEVRDLDLVLTPLVAFDRDGMRLGMGGGYYDRTFAFLRSRAGWLRPKLVGVAYGFQETSSALPREPWDVPLWGIVSERGCRICR